MLATSLRVGDVVDTPDGPGAVVHVDARLDWRQGGYSFGPGPVEVALDSAPIVETAPGVHARQATSYAREDVKPRPAADPSDADLAAFMAAHSTPASRRATAARARAPRAGRVSLPPFKLGTIRVGDVVAVELEPGRPELVGGHVARFLVIGQGTRPGTFHVQGFDRPDELATVHKRQLKQLDAPRPTEAAA